jgi:uncharacterized membrane protein YbaN (DUF454 family)
MVRNILLICGILSLILAFVGILLPLLPTVPLVLLASFLFSRSSPRFHRWLLNNNIFGPIIKDWEETKSISLKAKIISISILVLSIGLSVILFVSHALIRFILITIAIGVSAYIIRIPGKDCRKS